ncbi:MAG: NRDE family protein [Gammaproteobacteria bacterium]|nr:NRDE family protein [Gammaproteobacteria bacterium]
MCTLVVLYRPQHPWPLLIAANRDEMLDRLWQPPARYWPDRSNVVAGLDEQGGGSWFGLNDDGIVAGVMNRRGTLGPAAGKRSRGELVLEALEHAEAQTAAEALRFIDPSAYRPFNLVIADRERAYWLRHVEQTDRIDVMPLASGLSMITAYDCNDMTSPRVRRYLPLLRAAAVPDPERGDWLAWEALLASRESDAGAEGAMNVVTDSGFGTVSSALVALPARERFEVKPRFRFAVGRPGGAPYLDVGLG